VGIERDREGKDGEGEIERGKEGRDLFIILFVVADVCNSSSIEVPPKTVGICQYKL